MKTKEQRYNELYSSGLVDGVKKLFANRNDISEDYYVLMADYIDSMNEIKDEMLINHTEIARKMPELVKSIQESNLGGIYGRTDDNRIQIEQSLSYEDKKLYFFHELTHALQTSHENGREQCGFYNGHDGMFLTEGATQYTAEMLYNPVRYKYLKFVSGHPPKTCLRYSGEGMAGDFDISGENFILHNGFYKPEYDADGRFNLQWMRGTKCETFVRSLVDMPKKIKISFINEIEELEITVCVEGEEKQKFIGIKKGEQDIFSVIEHDYASGDILKVDIEINKLWNHHQVDGMDDTMPLGIAVKNI